MFAFLFLLLSSQVFAQSTSDIALSIRTNYTMTPVTSGASVYLTYSMPRTVTQGVSIFDSSGVPIYMYTARKFQDVTRIIIPAGGGGFPLGIPQGASVWLQAVGTSATTGESDINFFY
jgi:hypothetical protein